MSHRYTATWNGQVIAQSDETIMIEGNVYFPPHSIKREFFQDSALHTTCPWKGFCSYYDVVVNGQVNKDAAWYYHQPKEGSDAIVAGENGKPAGFTFADYVAFWNGVEVRE